MPLYGAIRLTRAVERERSRYGGECMAQFESHSAYYHPGIVHPFTGVYGVGCPLEFPDWTVNNRISLYKTFEYINALQGGILPYEITYAVLNGEMYPFKMKVFEPEAQYTLVNIPNLEKIHAETTATNANFEDPRISLFTEIAVNPHRLGGHPGLLTATEAVLYSTGFLRSIAYDNLSGESIEKALAEIVDAVREYSAFIDGYSANNLARLISPVDVDHRVTFPFSRQGPDLPMARWSPGDAPISLSSPSHFAPTGAIMVVDPVKGRPFLDAIERVPLTDFSAVVTTDCWGSWVLMASPYQVDRYAPYRRTIPQEILYRAVREHLGSLMQIFREHVDIQSAGPNYPSEEITLDIERNFLDEVVIRYVRASAPLHVCLEVYFDLAMASLTTYALSSSYGDYRGGVV